MILVVDDHRDTREVLARLLKLDGYEPLIATSGPEALELLKSHLPQLVLLDLNMPDMDGLELFAHLRADPRLAAVPVIMFTAQDGLWREKAMAAGVNAFVVKGALDWAVLQKEILRLAGPGQTAAFPPPANQARRTQA